MRQRKSRTTTAGFLLLGLLIIAPNLGSEVVPQNLASIAARLYRLVSEELQSSGLNAEQQEVARRTNSALRRAGLRYWAPSNVAIENGAAQAGELLGIDPSTAEGKNQLDDLLNLPPDHLREVLSDREGARATPEHMNELIEALDKIRSAGDMERTHQVDLGDGEIVEIRWDPSSGTVTLRARGDGSDGEPEYEGNVTGLTKLVTDPETGALSIEVSATRDEAVALFTERDLALVRGSIFGEWRNANGDLYIISAADERAGDIRPNPDSLKPLIEEAQAEIDAMKSAKEFVWVHRETGEIRLQDRFRSLDIENWDFQGERYKNDNAEAELAALDKKISELQNRQKEMGPNTMEQHDPADFNSIASSAKASPIRIEVRQPWNDNHAFVYDEAVFDGRRIAARRIDRVLADVSNKRLPIAVRKELIASWSPPNWLEIQAEFNAATGEIDMAGKTWALHVTYHSMSFGTGKNLVIDQHTPYYFGVRLEKEGVKSDMALAATDDEKP